MKYPERILSIEDYRINEWKHIQSKHTNEYGIYYTVCMCYVEYLRIIGVDQQKINSVEAVITDTVLTNRFDSNSLNETIDKIINK